MIDDPLVRVVLKDGRTGLYYEEDDLFYPDSIQISPDQIEATTPRDLSDGLSEGVSVLVLNDQGRVIAAYDLFEAMSERFGVVLVERALKTAWRAAGFPWIDP